MIPTRNFNLKPVTFSIFRFMIMILFKWLFLLMVIFFIARIVVLVSLPVAYSGVNPIEMRIDSINATQLIYFLYEKETQIDNTAVQMIKSFMVNSFT